jgi:hypothetical protein
MNGGHKNCVENKNNTFTFKLPGNRVPDFEVSVCSVNHKLLGTLLGASFSYVAGLGFDD